MSDSNKSELIYPPQEVLDQANVSDYEALYNYSVTDREGFWAEQAEKFNDSFQYEIQWSNIKTGVYLVKLSHDGVTINKPLIIQ